MTEKEEAQFQKIGFVKQVAEQHNELERRLMDLRMAHKCDKPLKHIP